MRMAKSVIAAQIGNVKMAALMKDKQLEVHPDKTGYIVLGSLKFKEKICREVLITPIRFGSMVTKMKTQDKYLGDIIHSDGLGASVEATVKDRIGKVKGAMYEAAAIMEDFRMQALGGMQGAWDMWELAIVPSLLNNCGVWTEISKATEDVLEELQNSFVRRMLHVPVSTPKVSLLSETGLLSMKHRVWFEKLRMVIALQKLEGKALAKQIYLEQKRQGWPGLISETSAICKELEIPDINHSVVPNGTIKKAIKEHRKKQLVELMGRSEKMASLVEDENGEAKEYMMVKNIADSRIMFRVRTRMVAFKENMKNMYGRTNLQCEQCNTGMIESQTHVLMCPGYSEQRVGVDLGTMDGLIKYYRDVMKIRFGD